MSAHLEDLHRSFARHLRAEGRSVTLEELTWAAIREWLAQLTDRQELSTVRTRHKGLQRFCGWLVAEDEIDANPMAGLEAPSATPSRSRCRPTASSRRC